MVSTRSHPRAFPEPTASPTKRSTTPTPSANGPATVTRSTSVSKTSKTSRSSSPAVWTHTPSNLALIWLGISLPLVVWDFCYVFLRPYSMPGGSLHWPIWQPYALYGEVDHVYGFKAFNNHVGFTAAQSTLNVIETLGYGAYLYIVWRYGREQGDDGTGAPSQDKVGKLGAAMTVEGRTAGIACLLGFAVTVMTWSKTILYWLNEAYSGFDSIGHNSWFRLVFLWIIPNGPWIFLPAYMTYVFGEEILQGLDFAATRDTKKLQ